ncbi:glycoside/pentoside/hexuronide:cation symporter, GPH family [Cyclonatronum proteinivorum]|uniref:Glycoside/pentoside/hexuronide:cation symporter, GPH family n=1 Tax=Cyclonatronum proteinivorum TaxID=1457365 RepID=A0A345UJS8_9BACT|nr:MFS transporter [Cyclonatronum proteinivorum]AXJ00730.1 glycoside/pentoside/hexuronide:cation symporter, GPH family [Cyclonatronum proteinivorum]
MSVTTTPAKDRVPFLEKAAFGSGHLVNNLLPGALGVFSFFLLTAFGMDPFLAGLLGGLPRLFDAITDPIMGYISDNTKSRFGRRRPYIFVGAILSGLLFMLLWQLDPDASQMYNFWYFLIFSLIYLIGNTMFSTPLIGLGYEMTFDYNERTRLMGFSQVIGQIAWMIVPWFWVLIANPDLFETQAQGVHQLAVIVGIACIVLGIMPALFCKEVDQTNLDKREKMTMASVLENLKELIRNMKLIAQNKPFARLCGSTFLVFNGFQMVASFSYFIIVFHMFNGDYGMAGTWPAWFSTVSALATAFLIIPIITMLANKYGKRNAFIISTIISIVGYLLKWWGFSPENPWLIFMPIPFMVFGIGGLFTLMMSMTADVCDYDELQHGMPRKEGSFGAIYWWMVKLGQGLALVLGGLVLKVVGFDPALSEQTAQTMVNLRLADIIIPSVTAALAVWVMWGYDLSEERAREIKDQLVARRGEL